MSWAITISRAKPNPAGKDSGWGANREQQLLGEWVDLVNTGDAEVRLSTLHLANTQFSQFCQPVRENVVYWSGRADQVLKPGQTLRVHTGRSSYASLMAYDDASGPQLHSALAYANAGVIIHAFAESGNFVLNNRCGDVISVLWKGNDGAWHSEDRVKYAPNPQEGRILVRQGEWLV